MEEKTVTAETDRLILRRYMDEVRHNLKWRLSTDEMGYVLNQDYRGKGYAKESCLSLVAQAFSHGIHRIYAECDPENKNSWKLLESLGFEREAHLKQNVYFWKDTYIYAKLKP